MFRSLILSLATGMLSFVAPQDVTAQYQQYPPARQYRPYQPPYEPPQQGPNIEAMAGTWYMMGDEDQPCEVIPAQNGNRARFVNEKGNRAIGYIRGDYITIPSWKNTQGRFVGDRILWNNGTVWTR